MITEKLRSQIDQLPTAERWRLVNHILRTLEHDQQVHSDWQQAVAATYGLLADDPIERPEQLPLTEREALE